MIAVRGRKASWRGVMCFDVEELWVASYILESLKSFRNLI
jgi:hypothetical protein